MKFITSPITAFIWTLVMLMLGNAQSGANSYPTIRVQIQDMLGTIDNATINTLGISSNSYKMKRDKSTNTYSANIPISQNEWMTKFVIQASSSRGNGKITELWMQGTPIWSGLKIPVYHYNTSKDVLGNSKTTAVLDKIEVFLSPKKALNINDIVPSLPNNRFQQLMRSYFQTRFLCQYKEESDRFLLEGVYRRACDNYFDLSYRLADILGANKPFGLDQYIIENWQTFRPRIMRIPIPNDRYSYMETMLKELPTKSIFNGCDLIIEKRPDLKKNYIEFLKNQFYELDSYGKKYLKDNAESQKCKFVRGLTG